jgi:hypothetical protein
VFGETNTLVQHDQYTIDNALTCLIYCDNKKRAVRGVLASALSLSVSSKWESIIESVGGGLGSGLIGGLDTLMQIGGGKTFQQPWFGRKSWKGTTPFVFKITMQFVALEDAKAEVYDPCINLLSFLYPREVGGAQSEQEKKASKKLSDMFSFYVIPGPSLLFDPDQPSVSEGDVVCVKIGNFLEVSACYITQCDIQWSQTMSPQGWPLAAKADLTIESMDSAYVGADGSFFDAGVTNVKVDIATTVKKFAEKASKAVEDGLSKVGGFLEG